MYIKVISETEQVYPYSKYELVADNPGTSFPVDITETEQILAEFGVYAVGRSDRPQYDPLSQALVEGTPVLEDGQWKQSWVVNPLPPEQVAANYTRELEAYYDRVAVAMRYDNRVTCALRAGYAGPFQSDGVAFASWMDQCNAYAYTVMDAVISGIRPLPTFDALVAELLPPPWAVE